MPEGGGSAVAISYFLLLRFALPRWPKLRDLALAAAFAFGARRLRSAATDSPGLRRCFAIVSSLASGYLFVLRRDRLGFDGALAAPSSRAKNFLALSAFVSFASSGAAGDSTGTTPRFARRLYGMVLP